MSKFDQFLEIAGMLNACLDITPLLFGSLGLQRRLETDLQADDIDILIPEIWLTKNWESLQERMEKLGYSLYDPHEHAFSRNGISAAFASVESLESFAGVDYRRIPEFAEGNVRYLLLTLEEFRKVYAQSALDGYRANKKNKQDRQKIALIDIALRQRGTENQ